MRSSGWTAATRTNPAPAGPAVILVAGILYALSVLFGSVGGVLRQLFPGRHLEA
jgi:zinc/manganese transport system permease protein